MSVKIFLNMAKLLKLCLFVACIISASITNGQRATVEESQEDDIYKEFPELFYQRTEVTTITETKTNNIQKITSTTSTTTTTTTKITSHTTSKLPTEEEVDYNDEDTTIKHENQFELQTKEVNYDDDEDTISHENQFDIDYELFWDEYDIDGKTSEKPKKVVFKNKNNKDVKKFESINNPVENSDWFLFESDLHKLETFDVNKIRKTKTTTIPAKNKKQPTRRDENEKRKITIPDGALQWFGIEGYNMKHAKSDYKESNGYKVRIEHDPSEKFDIDQLKNEGKNLYSFANIKLNQKYYKLK